MTKKIPGQKKAKNMTLAKVEVGQQARILDLKVMGPTRRRLLDLGLLPGTTIRALMKSPLGDPIAYDIRGSILALRLEDALKIVVDG